MHVEASRNGNGVGGGGRRARFVIGCTLQWPPLAWRVYSRHHGTTACPRVMALHSITTHGGGWLPCVVLGVLSRGGTMAPTRAVVPAFRNMYQHPALQ